MPRGLPPSLGSVTYGRGYFETFNALILLLFYKSGCVDFSSLPTGTEIRLSTCAPLIPSSVSAETLVSGTAG
jgi:hypothetical protein